MDNYGGGGGGGGSAGGFPIRNSSRAFNDPSGGGGGGGSSMMSGAERVVQPTAHYANSNGILSRPGGTREDGGGGGGGRAQQPSHEVFMVREASRGSIGTSGGTDGRSPFATSGNRFQTETGDSSAGEQQQRQVLPAQQQQQLTSSSSHSSSHHRERSERDRDKEKDHQQRQLPLPKMLKIAVVGDSTSGKTAICNAFTSEGYNFSRNYHMTTGVSIYAKSIKLPSSRPGGGGGGDGGEMQRSSGPEDSTNLLEPRINLVLVDSAGKPIYRELLPHYYERLDGLVLVLDLTSNSALESALDWLNLGKGSMQKQKHVPPSNGSGDQSGNGNGGGSKRSGVGDQPFLGVLIGSKTDLKDQRVISPKAAQDFASQHGLQYFECSAKENNGIEEPFFYLAHQWTNSGAADKENSVDGDVASSSGGIFAMNRAGNNSNSTSKRSAFGSRQGSSSEAF